MDADRHPPVSSRTKTLLAGLLLPLLLATIIGAVATWPSGDGPELRPAGTTEDATISALRRLPCEDTVPEAGIDCVRPEVQLTGAGRAVLEERPATEAAALEVGDRVIVARSTDATGAASFELVGRQRGASYTVVLVVAAALLLLVARVRGLRMLVALAASLLVLVVHTVPALLDGSGATTVGLVGAALVAFLVVGLGRGADARSATALVGTLAALLVAAIAGRALVEGAALAGLADAVPAYLDVAGGRIPTAGLLLAGVLIGTVGALSDLCTRVVDATWDLRGIDPAAGWRGVATAGMRRAGGAAADVAGTLVLAYAGAALPVLVLLAAGDAGVLDVVRGEAVAVEVARAAVGVLALASAVPLTAALSALVVLREAEGSGPGDPRRFRSRQERVLWGDTSA